MIGLSLFSGIGGLDMAARAAGIKIIAQVEIDEFCQDVLRRRFWVPMFPDIKDLKGEIFRDERIDIIFGGPPCQPVSVAGRKRGKDDSRYLWPEVSRLVREIRPRWCVFENVAGLLHVAIDDILGDLESAGYEVGVFDFEASCVAAPHRRERVFIVAHAAGGEPGHTQVPAPRAEVSEPGAGRDERYGAERGAVGVWGRVESQFRGVYHGVPHWLDRPGRATDKDGRWGGYAGAITTKSSRINSKRLKALGNAVVPLQALPVFLAVMEADKDGQA